MQHRIYKGNSNAMNQVRDGSVQLIVTSPPYPMIEMWDSIFGEQDDRIADALKNNDGEAAFSLMHDVLNKVWDECDRVLEDNCFICINIGDATRTIGDEFKLYSNHTAIINYFLSKGYSVLPDILWRKQTNAPNRFMGSGMYPAGAYVTYEHEYILVFRKGGKRTFTGEKRLKRQESAYFWEERNVWFSDLWDNIKGTSQALKSQKISRERSAAFPLEIPYRLVNMYSIKGDTVLDPFCGLGTTNLACLFSERNSIGIDISDDFVESSRELLLNTTVDAVNKYIKQRIQNHLDYINSIPDEKSEKCYKNKHHGFLVKTKQETELRILQVEEIGRINEGVEVKYKEE